MAPPTRRLRNVRTRTRPQPPAEPDLHTLFQLDQLDEARAQLAPDEPEPDADLPPREPTASEQHSLWCEDLGYWLERWRASAKGWPYINDCGFNVVVYRHGEGWAFRICEQGAAVPAGGRAEPSPVLLRADGYHREMAAKIAAWSAVCHLICKAGDRS